MASLTAVERGVHPFGQVGPSLGGEDERPDGGGSFWVEVSFADSGGCFGAEVAESVVRAGDHMVVANGNDGSGIHV